MIFLAATGRMSSNAQRDRAVNFIPDRPSQQVGYAGCPGQWRNGVRRVRAAADPAARDSPSLHAWVTAPPLSLVRTMLPYTLRDPYRLSTYKSDEYRALWPAAGEYLVNLCECANSGVVDMIMPGWQDYALSIDRMCSAVWGGQDPKAALQKAGAEWDASTQRLGAPAKKAGFLKIPGCYADHTIEKIGQAVHIT
jgi:multiple sugar transport system substrate-binding protein